MIQEAAVLIIVLSAAVYVVVSFIRSLKPGKANRCDGCTGCDLKDLKCHR